MKPITPKIKICQKVASNRKEDFCYLLDRNCKAYILISDKRGAENVLFAVKNIPEHLYDRYWEQDVSRAIGTA